MHLECSSCDRVFTKTEHLRRHERSHTKEKPFVCHLCNKAYARSDVLARHLRMHARKEQEENGTGSASDGHTVSSASVKRAKTGSSPGRGCAAAGFGTPFKPTGASNLDATSAADVSAIRTEASSPAFHGSQPPPLQPEIIPRRDMFPRPTPQPTHPYTASLSEKSTYSREALLEYQMAASVPWQQPGYANFPPDTHHGYGAEAQLAGVLYNSHQLKNGDTKWPVSSESFVRGSAPHIQNQALPAPAYNPTTQSTPFYGTPSAVSPESSVPAMNRWLVLNQHNNPVTNILNLNSQPDATTSMGISYQPSNGGAIREGRYAKVEQGFYTRLFEQSKWATAEKRWYDVLNSGTGDLFASCEPTCEPSPPGQRTPVSEACRLRMMRALFPESNNPYNPAAKLDYTGDLLSGFPTCADFDEALETYFQKFRKEAPFFHLPVFNISTCDPLLLLTMSCVGFGLGQKPAGNHFVQSNFDDLKDRIMGDLERKLNGITLDAMSGFATAFIFLKLAALFADRDHLTPCQMMYICMVSIAQTHGIFTDYGRKVTSTIFSQFSSVQATWKAWGRVESLKRIVVSMLRSDSAYCTFLRTAPIVRVNNIEMLLPCDDLLFEAPNADIWWGIVNEGQYPMIMPALSSHNSLDKLVGKTFLNYYSLHTVLNYLSLRGTDAYQKLLDYQAINRDTQPFVTIPYNFYIRDETGRNMVHHFISFIEHFQSLLPSFPQDWQRTNCLTFWHFLLMNICMNSDLLEITAGRAGGSAASYGATFTKEWVQTPAARRALLHSAQVYQLLANKQQTDMRSIYACFAVFQAALIMTLYVFASPGADNTQEAPTQPGAFEVTTLLDWAGMGAVGLDPNTPLQESAAARWIAHGGPWQFGGRHIDGFAGAIYLLDVYSDLLQTCGKWNYASMSRILVSMRNLLTQQG